MMNLSSWTSNNIQSYMYNRPLTLGQDFHMKSLEMAVENFEVIP